MPAETALLFIDVQNFCANPRRLGVASGLAPAEFEEQLGYYLPGARDACRAEHAAPAGRGCRKAGIEVMYTLIRRA